MLQLCAIGLLMMFHYQGWKALLGIILSKPLLNQACLDQVSVESGFDYLHGWRCTSLSEHLVSVLDSYHSKEVYIQVEFPVLRFVHRVWFHVYNC